MKKQKVGILKEIFIITLGNYRKIRKCVTNTIFVIFQATCKNQGSFKEKHWDLDGYKENYYIYTFLLLPEEIIGN